MPRLPGRAAQQFGGFFSFMSTQGQEDGEGFGIPAAKRLASQDYQAGAVTMGEFGISTLMLPPGATKNHSVSIGSPRPRKPSGMQRRRHSRIPTDRNSTVKGKAPSDEIHAANIGRANSEIKFAETRLGDDASARFSEYAYPGALKGLRPSLNASCAGATCEMVPQWIKVMAAPASWAGIWANGEGKT